jgi:hypothetical protein
MRCEITYDWRDGSMEFAEVADSENGTPAWLYHGLGICFRLPEREYDADKIVEEFRAEFGERLDALREGFEVVWDGHNHVGRWPVEDDDSDAQERRCDAEFGLRCDVERWEPCCGLEIWEASDYYHGGFTTDQILCELGITAVTTDEQLDTIAEDAQAAASVDGRKLSGLHAFVEAMRDVAQQAAEKEDA